MKRPKICDGCGADLTDGENCICGNDLDHFGAPHQAVFAPSIWSPAATRDAKAGHESAPSESPDSIKEG